VSAITKFLAIRGPKCQTARTPLLKPSETSGISGIVPPPVSEMLVRHYCQNEWARHLDDLMIRRTSWRHYRHDHIELAVRAAGWMAEELGWDEGTLQAEVAQYRQFVGASITGAPHIATHTNGHAGRPAKSTTLQLDHVE
jgi:glycerol-3-phosphate dehydrogenase